MRGDPKQGMCGAMPSPGTLQNCMMQQFQQSMHQMRLSIANTLERRESNSDIRLEYSRPAGPRAIMDRESPFPKFDNMKGRPVIADRASQPTTKPPVGDGIAGMAEPSAALVEAPSKKRKKKQKTIRWKALPMPGVCQLQSIQCITQWGRKRKRRNWANPGMMEMGKLVIQMPRPLLHLCSKVCSTGMLERRKSNAMPSQPTSLQPSLKRERKPASQSCKGQRQPQRQS